MAPSPDFFLDPTEDGDSRELRACWICGRLRDSIRDDYMLVSIEPPLIGQAFGLGGVNIARVLLATRHVGKTLFPITEWPAFVYVIRLLDETIIEKRTFSADQVEMIRWGTLHQKKAGTGP